MSAPREPETAERDGSVDLWAMVGDGDGGDRAADTAHHRSGRAGRMPEPPRGRIRRYTKQADGTLEFLGYGEGEECSTD